MPADLRAGADVEGVHDADVVGHVGKPLAVTAGDEYVITLGAFHGAVPSGR